MFGLDRRGRVETRLFDDLVGAGEQRLRHGEAQRLRGLQVDGKLVMGRLFDRQIAGCGALKNCAI